MNFQYYAVGLLVLLMGCTQNPHQSAINTESILPKEVTRIVETQYQPRTTVQELQELGLSDEEIQFLKQLEKEVKANNQQIDYWVYVQNAPTDNKGMFWYQCAVTLSMLLDHSQLDIRFEGRLYKALHIIDEMLKNNPHHAALVAQKIIILQYLAHGHWASAAAFKLVKNAESDYQKHHELAIKHGRELLALAEKAVQDFPDDSWFAEEVKDIRENFGSLVEK